MFLVISVIIKCATVSLHAPKKVSRNATRVHYTYRNPDMYLFFPRKGAEVTDLSALKLCETRGFRGQFHTKSMFLGQIKYILGTINTSTQSRVLRMRLNVSKREPTEVTTFWSGRWINGFEVEDEVEDDVG